MPTRSCIEPLGLISGVDAAVAVDAGVGRWLAGGPVAFTLVRLEGRVLSLDNVPEGSLLDLERLSAPIPDWAGLGPGPLVMGILNTTPDSFSDGGELANARLAIAAGERMLAGGVHILDVGGESTRPGAQAVPPRQEQERVLPVIRALARQGATISIDSRNAGTMERALDVGARIVNDVSALSHDPAAVLLIASRQCPVILMHMRGTPATMMDRDHYEDVAMDVLSELSARITAAEAGGVCRNDIAIDAGFGFSKTPSQSGELLRRLPILLGLACPLVVGVSRKAVIGMLTGEINPQARGHGSLAAALFALDRGARIVRVHDAIAMVQALRVWCKLKG